MVLGPGTVNCLQRGDFSACMGETFFGNGLTQAVEAEPAEEVAAIAQAGEDSAGTEAVAAADPAQPEGQAGSQETAISVSEAVLPSFGLVRVEPDGSAVIAGTATPDGEVRIFADEEQIGTETAEPTGDFAFVTEQPLPPGGVELRVLDVETDTYARESVVVVVQDDRTSEPIVVASEPGEASQILQGLEQPQTVAEAEGPAAQESDAPADETEPMVVAQAETPDAAAEPAETAPVSSPISPQSNAPAPAEPAAEAPGTPAGETATIAPPQPTPGGVTPQVEMPSPAEMVDNQVAPAAPAPEAPVAPMAAPEMDAQEPAEADAAVEAPATPAPDAEAPAEAAEPQDVPDEPAPAQSTEPSPAADAPEEQSTEQAATGEQPDEQSAPQAPEVEHPDPEQQIAELPATDVPVEMQPAAQSEAPATAQPEPDFVQPTIDAVEIDGDRNFFAGAGTDGMTVRLYVDNQVVGTTEIADGRWLVEAIGVLDQENQRVRIDMLAEDGTVVGRAEVDFVLDLPEGVEEEIVVADQALAAEEPAGAELEEQPVIQRPAAEEPAVQQPAAEQPAAQAPVPAQDEPAEPVEQPASPVPDTAPEPDETPALEPGAEEVPTLVGVTDEDGRTTSGLAIIRSGDNLWTIARRVYGEGMRYTQIFEANTDQIRDPDLIYPGQVFDLPETDQVIGEEETEGADAQ